MTYESNANHRRVLFKLHGVGVFSGFYQLLKTLYIYENWKIQFPIPDLGCHLTTWREFYPPLLQ